MNGRRYFECGGYRVIGYGVTFPGTPTINPTNVNHKITPQAIPIPNTTATHAAPSATERVLVADATISAQNNEINRGGNNYTAITGGWGGGTKPHRTPHLNGNQPAGGNAVMLDGHVEWRKFQLMRVRNTAAPYFWW